MDTLVVMISYDHNDQLGGGFEHVLFPPLFGEMIHFDYFFSMGLVQPPTSQGKIAHMIPPLLLPQICVT